MLQLKVQLLTEMVATASLDEERWRMRYIKELEKNEKPPSRSEKSPSRRNSPIRRRPKHRRDEENSKVFLD
jgi:hypothetical protein